MLPTLNPSPAASLRSPIPTSDLDFILAAQLAVAWAGEMGDEPRLRWWRTDLISEYGGEDLFRRLLPDTWRWAVLQAAREAARRVDADLRRRDHDPDRVLSLFNLGFDLNEQVEERLQELKRSGVLPREALPVLGELMEGGWHRERFLEWVESQGEASHATTPIGRRLRMEVPSDRRQRARLLVAALAPLPGDYPLPHFRIAS